MRIIQGFKNFLMRGDVVVVAIGLVVALAFSGLVSAFTTDIINPMLNRAQGPTALGLGVQLGHAGNPKTFLNFGAFVSAIIYFVIFMAIIYLAIVVPYRHISARHGHKVFGNPPDLRTCPECLSEDLPAAAKKCKYCGSILAADPG